MIPLSPAESATPRRTLRLHLARFIALGAGSGLSPIAPGTAGTLWAWAFFALLSLWLDGAAWGVVIAVSLLVGWWACTRTAQASGSLDPSYIVWDEIVAFWIVLWLITPCSVWTQLAAFALFRFFDAAKPGPVGWADRRFKAAGWRGGFGIILDDLVAALCTLLVIALALALWRVA